MALQKTITHAAAVAGVHTLTVSDVTRLAVGNTITVRGLNSAGASYDGTHEITALNLQNVTVSFIVDNHTHAAADVNGLLDVPVTWIDSNDVEGALGVAPASELDEIYLDDCVASAQEWVFDRRAKCGYVDHPNLVPNSSVRRGTITKAVQEYKERGSVESFSSFQDMPAGFAPVGGGLGEILRAIGCNRPRFA